MKNSPLNEQEWILIHKMDVKGNKIPEICKKINRPYNTVKRALRRFQTPPYFTKEDWYEYGKYCHEQSGLNRSKSRNKQRLKNDLIRSFVEEKLKKKWSPEMISIRLPILHPGQSISYEAIYDWIAFEAPEYEQYLSRGRYKKRQGKSGSRKRKKRVPKSECKSLIDNRPISADNRTSDGALEADLIIGKGRSCLLTVVNRKTRRIWIRKVKSKEAVVVFWILSGVLRTIPEEERFTLTLDNGGEFAKWRELESVFGIWVYFCHAYCSFEKGTVENRNGVIRNRFFPKRTNFDEVTREQIMEAENWINSYPMKILNGLTPLEAETINREKRELFKKAA